MWGFDYPDLSNEKAIPVLFIEKALGSLQGFLVQRPCSTDIKQQLCLDTAEGLACLHSCGIVHADLNPKNVLVVGQENPEVPFMAKVSDLGSSLDISDATSTFSYRDYMGTPGWIPPEVAGEPKSLNSGTELLKCDSWAFGLLAFSVFYTNGQSAVHPNNLNFSTTDLSLPSSILQLLHKRCLPLLTLDPEKRPRISSDLLSDSSKAYSEWSRARFHQTTTKTRLVRDEHKFWTTIDPGLLSRLNSEYDALGELKSSYTLPHNVLFGMALGNFQPAFPVTGFPSLGMRYLRAAAEAGSNAAKGIIYRLSQATESIGILAVADRQALEAHRESWLYDAASSGSLIAAADLQRTSPSKRDTAWSDFRDRGGYETMSRRDRSFGRTVGDSIEVGSSGDSTSVCSAAAQGNYVLIMELLSRSADVTVSVKPFGISCLHWLSMFDAEKIEVVGKSLHSAGAVLEARTTTRIDGIDRLHVPSEHFPFHWPIGTPFHWACFARCWTAMSVLLDLGAEVDALDAEDDSRAQAPLAMAMYRGDSEVVGFLLSHGADPRRVDGEGRGPLHMLALDDRQQRLFNLNKTMMWRCYHGDKESHAKTIRQCVVAVLEAGADLELRKNNGQTPLQDALEAKDGAVVLALLEAGAKIDCRFGYPHMLPVSHWISSVSPRTMAYPDLYMPILKILLLKSIHLDIRDAEERSLFHVLIQSAPSPAQDNIHGDFEKLHYYTTAIAELLKSSPYTNTVNSKDKYGITPLLEALGKDTCFVKELTELLLGCGASISSDLHEREELIRTICNNLALGDESCLELVKIFSTDARTIPVGQLFTMVKEHPSWDRRNKSALACAIENGYLETIRWMLGMPGVDLNQQFKNSPTALDSAADIAQRLRSIGLQRWDRHATTVPKNRRWSDYDELFWTPKYAPGTANFVYSKWPDSIT